MSGKTLITSAALACAMLATGSLSLAQHRYKLIDLGTLGGPASYAQFGSQIVSESGRLVGWADTSTPDPFSGVFCFNQDCLVSHAFDWHHGQSGDLGALPGPNSSLASWVSPNGLVAGVSENGAIDPLDSGLPTFRAVLWRDGKIRDLGVLQGGNTSWANAVNSRGQVVGFSENGTPDDFPLAAQPQLFGLPFTTQTRAFLWVNGEMKDLGSLGGLDAFAVVVNEEGEVAGYSYTNSTPNLSTGVPTLDPFFWHNGKMEDIGTLGGTFGYATWMNNRGEVVGLSNLLGDQISHAFIWRQGKLSDLGTLGGDNSYPGFVSDTGDVVGKADLPGLAPQDHHAILWRNARKTDLGTLPGDACSRAYWVNSRGQVVGNSESEALCSVPGEHAFLWEPEGDGRMLDLNELIPTGASLQLSHALAITDRGEIVGVGVPPGCPPSEDFSCGHVYVLIPCDDDDRGSCSE